MANRLTAGEDTEEVNMISITDFIKEQGIPHLDLLKIDAEGNDDKVRTCLVYFFLVVYHLMLFCLVFFYPVLSFIVFCCFVNVKEEGSGGV